MRENCFNEKRKRKPNKKKFKTQLKFEIECFFLTCKNEKKNFSDKLSFRDWKLENFSINAYLKFICRANPETNFRHKILKINQICSAHKLFFLFFTRLFFLPTEIVYLFAVLKAGCSPKID